MTTKLAHHLVTFSSPIGKKNVTTSQNIEVADAKGSTLSPSDPRRNDIKGIFYLALDSKSQHRLASSVNTGHLGTED